MSKKKVTRKKKTKKKVAPVKPRNAIEVSHHVDANPDDAIAQTLTRPEVGAAATIQKFDGANHEVNALARELSAQVAAVNGGDLKRAESMLISQSHTLDVLFNHLTRIAQGNMVEGYLSATETYLRLALKAQSQCRTTLETLAQVKNPPVVYARQANFANGPQQVNNNIPSQARENGNQPNKLSGDSNELLSNTGTSAFTGGVDTPMETVGAIDRTEVKSG